MKLTPRELEVIHTMLIAKSYKDAAELLKCNVYTVSKHLENARGKAGVRSTHQLLLRCFADKLITKEPA